MTDVLSRSFPAPIDWQAFERLCFDLYRRMWDTNDAELHGRTGQPQAGVDVYGHDRKEGKFVGVQCKGRDEGYGSYLTEAEINAEVDKAKTFEPALEVFIIATTAANDAKSQRLARELSTRHATIGGFEVRVQGWDTLKQLITDHSDLVSKHFQDIAPFDLLEPLSSGFEKNEKSHETTHELLAATNAAIASISEKIEPTDEVSKAIDETIKLVEDGFLDAALAAYERLWREHGVTATQKNKYRIRANIALVKMFFGRKADAVVDFKAAYDEYPEWPSAKAILATAYLLEGDRPRAFELAKSVLQSDPSNQQAGTVLVDASPEEDSASNVAAALPEALRGRFEILLGLSMRARLHRDFAAAEQYARDALAEKPDDWKALAALADSLLAPVTEVAGIGLTGRVPPSLQGSFNQALDLLRQAWAILTVRQDALRGAHVAANLITTLEVAGLDDEAAVVLDRALKVAPEFPPLLRKYAQQMADAGQWEDVLKALSALPPSDADPMDPVFRIQALLRVGRPEAALDEADALAARSAPGRPLEVVATIRLEAAKALGRFDQELDSLLPKWPKSILVRSVAVGLLPEADTRRAALSRELADLAIEETDPAARFHAAEGLYAAGDYRRAAELYEGLYDGQKDNVALKKRLKALILADLRVDSRKLFESLPLSLQQLPEISELGVVVYDRAGLLKKARGVLEATLNRQDDLVERLQWLNVVERLGDFKAATAWLASVPAAQQGRPRDLMRLALAIDRRLADQKALPIAYRALRAGYGDPQVHLCYMVGLFISGRTAKPYSAAPLAKVAPDTAVVLHEESEARVVTRVLETEPNPLVERDEIAADSDLALRLIGLSVGDEIVLDHVNEPATYVVAEIHSKYLYAHLRSLQRFEALFPENRAFGSFNVDESRGEARFRPILDTAKRRYEFVMSMFENYRQGTIPLATIARISGSSAFDVWDSFAYNKDVDIKVTGGTLADFQAASQRLAANQKAVIDPITLHGLMRLEIANRVKELFDDVGIVQTSIDLLREYAEEQGRKIDGQQGVFGFDGTNYRMSEVSPEVSEDLARRARAAVTFAESLTLLPAEAMDGVSEEAKPLFEELPAAFLDTVLAARGAGRLLLCDDAVFRGLALEAADVEGVWTQAASKSALEKGRISIEKYADINRALSGCSYWFTMIGHREFLIELNKDNWTISPTIERFSAMLARPTNEPSSVIKLISVLMMSAWPAKPDEAGYSRLFECIVSALKASRPPSDAVQLVRAALRVSVDMMFARVRLLGFRRGLLRTTYMTPIEDVVRARDGVAESAALHIGRVITSVLVKVGLLVE